MARRVSTGALLTRILCVLALVCLAFAHRPPAIGGLAGPSAVQVDLSQYALPDGTLPVLCHPAAGDGHTDHKKVASGCEACRISAALLLPEPAKAAQVRFGQILAQTVRDDIVSLHPARRLPGSGPQAPPAAV